ncbi:MAG: carbohydrate-binding family 9-like protein [Blastocatellia bacterium]
MKVIMSLLALLTAISQAPVGKYTEIAGLPPVPEYTVHKAKGKIKVDGQLSEKAWETAPAVSMLFPWEDQTGAKQPTTFRLLYDQNNLYAGYECEDADITATFVNHDDPVYRDDCVEIFLRPDAASDHYFGLEMNVRGVLYDYHYAFPAKHDKSPDIIGALLKTSMRGTLNQREDTDQGWTLELAIPWESLRMGAPRKAPRGGEQMRAQLNRWDGVEPRRRMSNWSNPGMKKPNPHNPERFGVLLFR